MVYIYTCHGVCIYMPWYVMIIILKIYVFLYTVTDIYLFTIVSYDYNYFNRVYRWGSYETQLPKWLYIILL